jgi:hypothetical protein
MRQLDQRARDKVRLSFPMARHDAARLKSSVSKSSHLSHGRKQKNKHALPPALSQTNRKPAACRACVWSLRQITRGVRSDGGMVVRLQLIQNGVGRSVLRHLGQFCVVVVVLKK